MYTITREDLGWGVDTFVQRDGRPYAIKLDGEKWHIYAKPVEAVEITRSQAFRYWKRHFDCAYVWELPEVLYRAIYKE